MTVKGLTTPLSRWLQGSWFYVQVLGDLCVVSYWIDTLVRKNWGKCLRYFAASPFLLQGKTNACSRGSRYARVEHKEFWAIIVILLTTNVLFWSNGIVAWSALDQPYMSTFMRPVPPTDMQLVLHKGGWRVSVSPTLVESNLSTAGPCWRLKQHTWWKIVVVLMRR